MAKWTILEAKTQILQGLSDHESESSPDLERMTDTDALGYLVKMANNYVELKAELENLVYKIQLRDSSE